MSDSSSPSSPSAPIAEPNERLVEESRRIEQELQFVYLRYSNRRDIRWMFAYAHYRITHLINLNIRLFRKPDPLMKLNLHFATAFLNAVARLASAPWNEAFDRCEAAEFAEDALRLRCRGTLLPSVDPYCIATEHSAIKACSVAMANVHINVDLENALRDVGCIDREDYGNVLVFVERSARESLKKIHGRAAGDVYADLKELLLPLDKIWRNSVYERACNVQVPDPDPEFSRRVEIDVEPLRMGPVGRTMRGHSRYRPRVSPRQRPTP